MNVHVVIMAGGVGSRLWPVSTPEYPKQFIDLLGTGKSLLQMTYERFLPLAAPDRIWVVTAARYTGIVASQLPDVPEDNIIGEPMARNTAPCIAYVSWKIHSRFPDSVIVVTPSDALVHETDIFRQTLAPAIDSASTLGRIVTVGIVPDRPATGYGYIHCDAAVPGKIAKVQAFKEKPTAKKAVEYLESGGYYWNAGIFVWHVKTVIGEYRRFAPRIAELMDEMAPCMWKEEEKDAMKECFPLCDNISVDYAIMEKAEHMYLCTGSFHWSDLGGWTSLRDNMKRDQDGNAVVGEKVHLYDCRDCIVHSDGSAPAVVQGLENYVVAVREGRTLVCSLDKEQKIKDYAAR